MCKMAIWAMLPNFIAKSKALAIKYASFPYLSSVFGIFAKLKLVFSNAEKIRSLFGGAYFLLIFSLKEGILLILWLILKEKEGQKKPSK